MSFAAAGQQHGSPVSRAILLAVPLAALSAAPMLHLLSRSLSSTGGGNLSIEHYTALLSDATFLRAVGLSLWLAATVALGSTLVAALSGFVLAYHRFRGRGAFVAALIGLSALPPQLLLPGGYELVVTLGLFDSHGAVLVPALLSTFAVLLMRAAFASVPEDLLAAARIDGCSDFAAFWHVCLPAVRPVTATCLLLSFTATYNGVVWPTIVLQSPHLHTAPILIATLSGNALTDTDQARVTAATLLAMGPLFALFLLLQRDFLPPLGGAVKG